MNIQGILKSYSIAFAKLAELHTYYRVQPKGKSIHTHQSGLAYEKVPGIFAFEDPNTIYDTYTWIHIQKNINNYEIIKFLGELVDRPSDSEGVVVKPEKILERIPMKAFVS
jgi:hypothetical protein